ncbi:phosphotransferase [Umezawaea endophytica]|uniref:Aminoglycoside phosphotransferase family protein n=1 Tax=Umezawaea endophytica TaxID=1654476 RepID=A0A9X3A649_9PSEU|nr:aminoglycoside phosphotransferase family protein [Umezawaea endophytica]MCS7484409.1 aminoglycoside phosphotransferase family protein [Umezawaea endophytica]
MATTDTNGRFDSTSAVAVLAAACAAVDRDSDGAELLRLGENAIFRLRDSACVVRIGRNMSHWTDAAKEVAVSAWLVAHDFPAAEALELPQPLEVDGHPVTFWKHIHGRNGSRQDVGVLAELLRELHSLKAPEDFRLPERDVLDRVRPRIESSQVSAADKRLLVETCERLESELAAVDFPLSPAPTHGDAHVQNLMITDSGPVLIDFERFSWGQPEWDLATTATEYRTAGWWTDAEYARFVDVYGFDVTEWSGFGVLRAVNEINMTTWIMQNVRESEEIAAEYETRMRTIRAGKPVSAWKPF